MYIDDKLASDRPVHYVGDYYAGIPLKSIETTMLGDGASTFGIDNIYFYPAEEPSGYDGEAVYYYTTHQILSEHTITFKTPLLSDTHTVHNFVQVEVFEPECAISGYTLTTCDGCGGQMISDEVPATGHNYDNGVNVPANCVDAGFFVKTCYGCGQKTGEPTEPATGHIHGDDAKVVAPTCQADGYTEGNCKYCGFFFTVTDEGTKTGHQLGDDAVMVKATCSVNGGLTGKCKYCGTDYIDPDTFVEAYGHYDFTFSEYTTVEPTCTEGGYEEHKCLSCGETYKDNEVEAKGHRSYDVIDGNIITTKCVDCDYTNSLHVYTEGDIPDYAEMESVVKKDNMILSYYANESTWGTNGSLTAANAPRYAKWTDVNENGNSFARIEIASFESIKSLLTPDGNAHAHRDYMASSKSKPGATLVFEFDVKHPEELEDHQTNGFISVSGYADSGSNTFSILTVQLFATVKRSVRFPTPSGPR